MTDPWLAKVAVLGVNLWLGFPYTFLICTGALQSIPGDVLEAAKLDGAGPLRTWKSVIMPLLLVSTEPLLISSFAFNFNNFTLIYRLTGGGPRFADASVPLGHTDILISMVCSISGVDGGAAKNYGPASALSIVIFLIAGRGRQARRRYARADLLDEHPAPGRPDPGGRRAARLHLQLRGVHHRARHPAVRGELDRRDRPARVGLRAARPELGPLHGRRGSSRSSRGSSCSSSCRSTSSAG